MVRHLFSTHTKSNPLSPPLFNNEFSNSIDNATSIITHQPSSRPRASSTTLSSLTKRLPKVPFPHLPHHLPHLRRHSHTAATVYKMNESHNYDGFSPLHSSKPYNNTDTMSMSPVDTPTGGQNYDDLSPSQASPLPASVVNHALLDSPRPSPKVSSTDNTHTNTLQHKPVEKKNNTTHTLHIPPSSPPPAITNTGISEPNSDHTSCSLFTIFNPLLLLCTPCHTATATITTPLPTNDDEAINDLLVQNNNSIDYKVDDDRYNSSFMKCV